MDYILGHYPTSLFKNFYQLQHSLSYVLYKIMRNVNSWFIVTIRPYGTLPFNLHIFQDYFKHNSSQISNTIDLNSALVLDQATTFCFLLLHVTRLPPKKVKYPEVNLLWITDLA